MKKQLLFGAVLLSASTFAQINNGDFENWSTNVIEERLVDFSSSSNYPSSNVVKMTDAQHQNTSVKIENIIGTYGDTVVGYVSTGIIGTSGVPYTGVTGTPDSLIVWTKYDIQNGDLAVAVVKNSLSGAIVGSDLLSWTGTQSTWERKAFKLSSVTNLDSISISFFSGDNVAANNAIVGSWIQLDNLQVKTTTGDIYYPPNFSFENWDVLSVEQPDGWSTMSAYLPISGGVTKSTDAYSNTYAAKITTENDPYYGVTPGMLESSNAINFSPPSIELAYKYTPAGADLATITVELYSGNVFIGGIDEYEITTATSSYTLLNLPMTYTSSSTADSIFIYITSGDNAGSTLYVDDIKTSGATGIDINTVDTKLSSYPNPVSNDFNLVLNTKKISGIGNIAIYNLSGKLLMQEKINVITGANNYSINLEHLDSGFYQCVVTIGTEMFVHKIVKK